MFEKKRLQDLVFDRDKMEDLIRENYMCIYKYCFYHLGDRDTAQDITQEVFLKFIKEIGRYREYGKLKNYLYVIARNSIRDYGRRKKPLQMASMPEVCDDGGIGQKLLQMNIREALDSLEELDKELIILRYYQELRIKDISRILHLPASTVRYRLKNAEKAMKKRLEL